MLQIHDGLLLSSNTSPIFVRFVNMVINDSTFLLDESLAGLEKIHDIESLMENEREWNNLPEVCVHLILRSDIEDVN